MVNGGISAGDLVGKSENGPWHEAKSVPGLVFPDSEKSAELSDDQILDLLGEYDYEPETSPQADEEKEVSLKQTEPMKNRARYLTTPQPHVTSPGRTRPHPYRYDTVPFTTVTFI